MKYAWLLVATLLWNGASSTAKGEGEAQPIQSVTRYDYDVDLGEYDLFAGVEYSPTVPNTFFTALRSGALAKWLDTDVAAQWQRSVGAPTASIEDFAISPDGQILAVVGGPAFIRFLSAESGDILPTAYHVGDLNPLPLTPHFTSVAFSPDRRHFAAGDANGHIFIWSMTQPEALAVLKSQDHPIKELTFTELGDFLVSTSNVEVLIWSWIESTVAVDLGRDIASGPFWAETAYLPPYERRMVVTTYHDVVLFDFVTREILGRFPVARDDDDDEPSHPLLTVTNPEMTHLWRFNKEALVERLNIDTGAVDAAFIDPSLFDGAAFAINAYVKLARKPHTPNEFAVGLLTWKFNFFTGQLTMHSRLRSYRLPL